MNEQDKSNLDNRPILFLFTPGRDYVRPYFERLMPEYRISASSDNASAAIMISTCDIYDVTEGSEFNEYTPLRHNSTEAAAEREFESTCSCLNIPCAILRCAAIICTGMQDWPRQMAESINRGTFIAIKDNPATRSLIHASDLPQAAHIALTKGGIYNVTDGYVHNINSIADALAWRMAQKRIFHISEKWFRLIYGKKRISKETCTLTFSSSKLMSAGSFHPVSAVDYLKNHVYDENSL